ncbi:MAG: hypothetical protein NC548_38790 [Lachnospiraceae bacterium]|nr:hypothetical protein [Lachnospiraceae bacterium]
MNEAKSGIQCIQRQEKGDDARMGRLIWHGNNGTWGLKGLEREKLCTLPGVVYGALCKLKDYEDICDSPDKVRRMADLLEDGAQYTEKREI